MVGAGEERGVEITILPLRFVGRAVCTCKNIKGGLCVVALVVLYCTCECDVNGVLLLMTLIIQCLILKFSIII